MRSRRSTFSEPTKISAGKAAATSADATYAVDAVSPDWNEQAAKAAKSYLDTSAFSRSGLIKQLMYEGNTEQQAVYGVNQTGL